MKGQYYLGDVLDSLLFSDIQMLGNSFGDDGKDGEAEARDTH